MFAYADDDRKLAIRGPGVAGAGAHTHETRDRITPAPGKIAVIRAADPRVDGR